MKELKGTDNTTYSVIGKSLFSGQFSSQTDSSMMLCNLCIDFQQQLSTENGA